MRTPTRHFLIGLFVMTGAGLGVAGAIVFGAQSGLRGAVLMETYFNESVQGLEVGSPVRYLGVKIGEVREISTTGRVYGVWEQFVVVRMAVHPRAVVKDYVALDSERLQQRIEEGLRVQLASQGLTGAMYLEARFHQSADLAVAKVIRTWATDPAFIYVPSVPSTIERIGSSLESILVRFAQLDLDGLVASGRRAFDSIEAKLQPLDTVALGQGLERASTAAERLFANADGALPDALAKIATFAERAERGVEGIESVLAGPEARQLLADVRGVAGDGRMALADLSTTIADVRALARRIDGVVAAAGPDLQSVLAEVQRASEHLTRLAALLERHPSLLLFSEPPPPVRLNK
jgi:ABC-type transporter Mla subunit MlaD